MPVECTFTLNRHNLSVLNCPGFGGVPAFSGNGRYVNDPNSTAVQDKGPLPTGTYYIVDRQSGGHLGWLYDAAKDLSLHTHRADWFALYRNDGKIDDWTTINGIRRGHFRLHPVGRLGESDGCITLSSRAQFDRLRAFLKAQPAFQVPGTTLKAYGKVTVR
ncbi:DUF2778 domain-containing protein [Burkholderia sp. FERM BP-3421]|uniref:DUF2778 domain-containing protein n=1 Tax=Burkholderia sp. FERM BP-3421 TaxID=1494466 RepID=UPI0023605F30|nr:DUF2778 domain-containing protein [Burkholderia sp. FERM BP-3421]WDD95909.1 DUF2778 domain-containing protein [Burkholderia sp. FERM BP-3421]